MSLIFQFKVRFFAIEVSFENWLRFVDLFKHCTSKVGEVGQVKCNQYGANVSTDFNGQHSLIFFESVSCQDLLNENIIRDVIKQKEKKKKVVFLVVEAVSKRQTTLESYFLPPLFSSFSLLLALRALTRAYNAHLAHRHYTRLLEKSVNMSTNIFGAGVSIIQRFF